MDTLVEDLYKGLIDYIDYEKKTNKIKTKDIARVIQDVASHYNIRLNNEVDS